MQSLPYSISLSYNFSSFVVFSKATLVGEGFVGNRENLPYLKIEGDEGVVFFRDAWGLNPSSPFEPGLLEDVVEERLKVRGSIDSLVNFEYLVTVLPAPGDFFLVVQGVFSSNKLGDSGDDCTDEFWHILGEEGRNPTPSSS